MTTLNSCHPFVSDSSTCESRIRYSCLCLIERSLHKFINKKCFDPALWNIKVGETVDIEIPDFGPIALRRDYNGFIDRKLAHAKDRNRFYAYLRKWGKER